MHLYSILRLAGDKRLAPAMHGPLMIVEISHIFGCDKISGTSRLLNRCSKLARKRGGNKDRRSRLESDAGGVEVMVVVWDNWMAASHWSVGLASPEYQTSLPHKTSPPPFSNFLLPSYFIIHSIHIYPYYLDKLFPSLPDTFRPVVRLSEVITFGTLLWTLGTLDLVTNAPNPARDIPLLLITSSTIVHHNDLTSKCNHFYDVSIKYEYFIPLTVV